MRDRPIEAELDRVPAQDSTTLPPSPDDVRDALERIIASSEFRSSPHLAAFLRYSVETSLNGEGASIKAYSVATAVLGRPPTFDPQTDPIVRVEATRLRRALERYYLHDGADDPVHIEIPRGRYIAFFSFRHAQAVRSVLERDMPVNGDADLHHKAELAHSRRRQTSDALHAMWRNLSRGEKRSLAIFGYALVGAIITWGIVPILTPTKLPTEQALILQPLTNSGLNSGLNSADSAQITTGSLPRVDSAGDRIMFAMLQLTPFSAKTDDRDANEIGERLINQIASRSRRFDGIPVIDPELPSVFIPAKNDLYALVGSIFERDDDGMTYEIAARLVHQPTREIIWTGNYTIRGSAKSSDSQLHDITNAIVAALTGLDGAIRVDDARRHHDAELPSTNCQMCIADSDIALRTHNPELIAKAIACMSALAVKKPQEALIFKQLAALRLASDTRGRDRAAAVTDAIADIETALRLDPDDPFAHDFMRQLQSARANGSDAEIARSTLN